MLELKPFNYFGLYRFKLHILAYHFTTIRHYGFLQNNGKYKCVGTIRKALKSLHLKAIVKIPDSQRILEKNGEGQQNPQRKVRSGKWK